MRQSGKRGAPGNLEPGNPQVVLDLRAFGNEPCRLREIGDRPIDVSGFERAGAALLETRALPAGATRSRQQQADRDEHGRPPLSYLAS